jgi:signal transduction histidine kinase/CheY-like chemotaxis protein
MRLAPSLAAVPLLLLLLTWLALRGIDSGAQTFNLPLQALDTFEMLENALHRDVLSARAGLLRNYDPLAREVDALDDALAQIRATVPQGQGEAALARLAASLDQQETLTEHFKTDNAVLQNSLASFGMLSVRLSTSDRNAPLVPAVSGLAAAILHLTLDTSADATGEVADRLAALAAQSAQSADPESVEALLAHGRVLANLLPATDEVLKAFFAVPSKSEQDALHGLIVAHQEKLRREAGRFRLLLYVTSVVLLGVLTHLGLRLRARARDLMHRARFEHLIAGISTRFINSQPHEIGLHVENALGLLAQSIGADRAYFVLAGAPPTVYAWCGVGVTYPPGWPEQALSLATRFTPAEEGVIHVKAVQRLLPGTDRTLLTNFGMQGWACIPTIRNGVVANVLGFDALKPHPHFAELGLLRMALDAIANAVGRQGLEQERARLEMRLQQTRRMETIGALASGIAHNFNNILGAILGYAEMEETRIQSEGRTAPNLGAIRRAGERARDLVDQILTFGRRRDTRPRPVSVPALVREAVFVLQAILPSKIELVVPEIPATAIVSGEHAQLQQVILNFCNNAAQAMNGSGCIEIGIDVLESPWARSLSHGVLAPGRYVCIAVRDNGRGMDATTLGRIFEPFFTTRAAGNGLGLATVREIVREHGGAINVHSRPGAGSRFEAWLPCLAEGASAQEDVAPTHQLGRGETVLVIDDTRERLLRDEDTLAALGYEPVGFTNAADAIAACRAAPGRFDALLLSHPLPGMALADLVATLHETIPDTPILLAMASSDEMNGTSLAAISIAEILHRPLASSEVAAALARCLLGNAPAAKRGALAARPPALTA